MITIFICKDDDLAKEITSKYLSREKLPYVSMLDDITYDQAVNAIEAMKPGKIKQDVTPEAEATVNDDPKLEEQGWTPVAITEECLKPDEDCLMLVVAFEKEEDGKKIHTTSFRAFAIKELKQFVETYSPKIIKEADFNKKYSA